jgi:hypothetical protein
MREKKAGGKSWYGAKETRRMNEIRLNKDRENA